MKKLIATLIILICTTSCSNDDIIKEKRCFVIENVIYSNDESTITIKFLDLDRTFTYTRFQFTSIYNVEFTNVVEGNILCIKN
jgi:hypothetical protein